jgi:hypothetical protein
MRAVWRAGITAEAFRWMLRPASKAPTARPGTAAALLRAAGLWSASNRWPTMRSSIASTSRSPIGAPSCGIRPGTDRAPGPDPAPAHSPPRLSRGAGLNSRHRMTAFGRGVRTTQCRKVAGRRPLKQRSLPARKSYTSVCSAISRASSTSMPRYRTVLSNLLWPSSSCTALRFFVRR